MPPDRREVDRIFSAALDLPAAERAAFVARECAGDEALRTRVEHLLQAERASLAAFEAGAAGNLRTMEQLLDEPVCGTDPRLGQQLGAFRLVQRIGEGGMAVVYLGERHDGQFEQRVAVKLLRRSVDVAEDVARFHAERRILCSLDHPNIARLIDGGTTADGLPYLVTEFVDGAPITTYCSDGRLDLEARLDLFLQVADAVHHAHQKLVVHRDLKPSNVMVDAAGRVRLLDFGIAKLLDPTRQDPAAPVTRVGRFVMTPEYAAPEQLAGNEVTTATDVFQLGVLLHEMLTGKRPTESGRPAQRLRGDLDAILLMALQPDPGRRYDSAAAFAADVRNHLRGEPITARPERTRDLLQRVVRRNPFATAAVAAALVLLVGWLVSLQFYSRELTRERDAAQAQSLRATRAYQLLLDLFRRADPLEQDSLGGQAVTVWDSLDAAADVMRSTLRDEPATLADLLVTLARLYRTGNELDQSRELLLETLSLQRQVSGSGSAVVAVTLGELGAVESERGNEAAAAAYLDEALRIARRLPREEASHAVAVFLDAGHAAIDNGDAQAAVRHFAYAESLLRESSRADPNALIETLFGMGNALNQLGQPDRAEAPILESVRLAEELYGTEHSRLAGPLSALAGVQRRLGRHEPAATSLRRAIKIMEREYGTGYSGVLSARNNLALVLGAAGDRPGEQSELRTLIELKSTAVGPEHPSVADHYQNLGASLHRSGRYEEALAALAVAQRIYDTHLPDSSPRRAFPRLTRAVVRLDMGDAGDAALAAEAAVEILARTLPEGHFATGIARCLQAEALLAQGDTGRAADWARAAWLAVERAPAEQDDYVGRCRSVIARTAPTG